jgi:hypothetical protein
MRPTFRWHWGFVPVICLLALLWYEFWSTYRLLPPAPPASVAAADPSPVPEYAPNPPPDGAPVAPMPVAEVVPDKPVLPEPLPPISLSVTNAPLSEVVTALNRALGEGSNLAPYGSANRMETYTLDAKNRPFWEVLQALNAQHPIGLDFTSTALRIQSVSSLPRGSVSIPAGAFRNFQVRDSVVLGISSVALQKTGTGLADVPAETPSQYTLTLLGAVDPRLVVVSWDQISISDAVDDAGRSVSVNVLPVSSGASAGYSLLRCTWQASDPAAKTISLKCQVCFACPIPDSDITATLDDAQNKVGEDITLGDRRIRLARFTTSGTMLQVQLAPEIPDPSGAPMSITITDSKGRTVLTAKSRPLGSSFSASASLASAAAPFRITLRSFDKTQDYRIPFELRNIPLP